MGLLKNSCFFMMAGVSCTIDSHVFSIFMVDSCHPLVYDPQSLLCKFLWLYLWQMYFPGLCGSLFSEGQTKHWPLHLSLFSYFQRNLWVFSLETLLPFLSTLWRCLPCEHGCFQKLHYAHLVQISVHCCKDVFLIFILQRPQVSLRRPLNSLP